MLEHLKNAQNYTQTTNGAVAYKSTLDSVLDLFARGGAARNVSDRDVIALVDKAYATSKPHALATIFHLGDIRGGQGERRFFKLAINHIAKQDPDTMAMVMKLIPEYSRWDYLYELVGTRLESQMFALIKEQLTTDINSEHPSLLAKWLKSANASSATTKKLAVLTRTALGMSPKQYRLVLSTLRKKLNIIETAITTGDYDSINYKNVPSNAFKKYIAAFYRHDKEGIEAFTTKVETGEVKIRKQTTLYPHDLVEMSGGLYGFGWGDNKSATTEEKRTANMLWNNLPDYLEGTDESAIAVVDTSGSMNGLPIQVAVALGLYTAERLNGPFKNHFITFSGSPELQEVKGTDLANKVKNLSSAPWGGNTNLEAVFELILDTAVRNRVPQSEVPSKLLIISDMQFDSCVRTAGGRYGERGYGDSFMNKMRSKFEAAGYKLPQLMFWQVNATSSNFPMKADEQGGIMVSGFSPSILQYVLKGEFKTPVQGMLDTITSERYLPIFAALGVEVASK